MGRLHKGKLRQARSLFAFQAAPFLQVSDEMLGHLLAVVPALVAPSQPAPGRAAAAGGSGSSFWSDAWTNAQLQGSSWRLKLDVGREEGTQLLWKTRPLWPAWPVCQPGRAGGRSGLGLALGGACWIPSWPKSLGTGTGTPEEHYLNTTPTPASTPAPTPAPTPNPSSNLNSYPNQARRCRRSGARRARACRCRWTCASPAIRSRAGTSAGPSRSRRAAPPSGCSSRVRPP